MTDVIAVFSPPSANGGITIVAPAVMGSLSDVRTSILESAPTLIEDLFGEPRPAGLPVPLPSSNAVASGLMVPLTVSLDDGSEARIEATGYAVAGRRLQLFLIAFPAAMNDSDPVLAQARTLVDQWRSVGTIVNESLGAERGRGQPASAGDDGPLEAAAPSGDRLERSEDRIENVIQFLRYAFDAKNPSASAEPVPVTALLLKDGRVFEDVRNAPDDFDPATRPPGSAGTGRWQPDGEAYALAFADGTQGTAVAGAAKTFPAPASLLFTGTFRALSGKGAGVLTEEISFYLDGSLLLKSEGSVRSGIYGISGRTARIKPENEPGEELLFGYRGEAEAPSLLILGSRIYERVE